MVKNILNLLRTVNMGRLGHKRESDIQPFHFYVMLCYVLGWCTNKLLLESLCPKQPSYLIPDVKQRQREHLRRPGEELRS